jgi:hypothetical protein
MTRRSAIFIGLGLPAWAAARPFWDEKDPKDWTDDERKELLTKSPWARPASVHYYTGPGGLVGVTGRGASNSRRGGRPAPGAPAPSDPVQIGASEALIRWESALPIREADHSRIKDDPAANYILSLTGDIPILGQRASDETEADLDRRMEALKQYTKLEKKGDPIWLNKIGRAPGSGTLFYFERNDLIRLQDHQVTFVSRLGPIEVKAKFPLNEMLYHGKLEL